jgi:hypothetical protein
LRGKHLDPLPDAASARATPAPFASAPPAGMSLNPQLTPVVASRRRTLRRLVGLAAGALVAGASPPARADIIGVEAAEVRADEDDYVLNAEFDLALNGTLEEALHRGVPLYFVLEFEIARPRWYWFDEKVLTSTTHYRIAWNALTRQYRVSSGLFAQNLYSLEEVQRFLSRVTSRPVARREALQKGSRYEAAVRLRLDVAQLPKPFQVDALASREWSLQSDWYRWSFTA